MLDLLIVLAFIVYAVSASFRARRKASEGLGEYFLAGKSIKGWRSGYPRQLQQVVIVSHEAGIRH